MQTGFKQFVSILDSGRNKSLSYLRTPADSLILGIGYVKNHNKLKTPTTFFRKCLNTTVNAPCFLCRQCSERCLSVCAFVWQRDASCSREMREKEILYWVGIGGGGSEVTRRTDDSDQCSLGKIYMAGKERRTLLHCLSPLP